MRGKDLIAATLFGGAGGGSSGGGDVNISAFKYVETGTITPAEDMRYFKPNGYIYDANYNTVSLFVYACNYSAAGIGSSDYIVGVDAGRTRISRKKGGSTDSYYPQSMAGKYDIGQQGGLRAGVTYAYVYAYDLDEETT